MSDFGYSLEPIDHDPFADQPRPYQQQPSGEFAPYQAPSVTEAKNQLYGLTGIPDIQEARAAYSRGEYLPALGQGAVGAANLGASVLGPIGALERLPASAAALARAAELGVPAERAKELGIFAGRKSLLQPENNHGTESAETMERMGFNPQMIFQNTGWFRGPDDQWKFPISDETAKLKPDVFNEYKSFYPDKPSSLGLPYGKDLKLPDILDHPELFQAYPHLKDVNVGPTHPMAALEGLKGNYTHNPEGAAQIRLTPDKEQELLSTLMHEVQHGVQYHEGFAVGGMPDEFLPPKFNEGLKIVKDRFRRTQEALTDKYGVDIYTLESALAKKSRGDNLWDYELRELDKVPDQYLPQIKETLDNLRFFEQAQKDANQNYKDLGGEVESRLVQQQLKEKDWGKLPWQYEGYTPPAEQILKYYTPENKAQYVITDPNLLDTAKKHGVRALHSNGFPLGTYYERVDHQPDFGNLEVGR